MYSETKVKWLLGLILVFIVLLITGLFLMHYKSDQDMKKVGAIPLTRTYYQDIKARAASDLKNANKNLSPSQLAQAAVTKQIGLNSKGIGYSIDSVQNSDGPFIKQGIMDGNGIPYTSNYTGDRSTNGGVDTADEEYNNYVTNVKQNSYNELLAKASAELQNQNGVQKTDLQQVIAQAKKDQETKNNNLRAKNLPAQFVKENQNQAVNGTVQNKKFNQKLQEKHANENSSSSSIPTKSTKDK